MSINSNPMSGVSFQLASCSDELMMMSLTLRSDSSKELKTLIPKVINQLERKYSVKIVYELILNEDVQPFDDLDAEPSNDHYSGLAHEPERPMTTTTPTPRQEPAAEPEPEFQADRTQAAICPKPGVTPRMRYVDQRFLVIGQTLALHCDYSWTRTDEQEDLPTIDKKILVTEPGVYRCWSQGCDEFDVYEVTWKADQGGLSEVWGDEAMKEPETVPPRPAATTTAMPRSTRTPPQVTLDIFGDATQTITVGGDVSWDCRPSDHVPVIWERVPSDPSIGHKPPTRRMKVFVYNGVTRLNIVGVKPSDGGEYKCSLNDGTHQIVRLIVEDGPNVHPYWGLRRQEKKKIDILN
jgi:hypothetical protein